MKEKQGDARERALKAGKSIKVKDKDTKKVKEYTLRPIDLRHLCDLERQALEFHQTSYMRAFKANLHLFGDDAVQILREEMRIVAKWDLDDLPKKMAYDCGKIPLTDRVKAWVKQFNAEIGGEEGELSESRMRALLTTALDQERLKLSVLKKMTEGKGPMQARVRYDQWWTTACMEGMVNYIFHSIRVDHPEVTKEDIRGWPIVSLYEGSRKVESITTADLGNG